MRLKLIVRLSTILVGIPFLSNLAIAQDAPTTKAQSALAIYCNAVTPLMPLAAGVGNLTAIADSLNRKDPGERALLRELSKVISISRRAATGIRKIVPVAAADFNHDGRVDQDDVDVFLGCFGNASIEGDCAQTDLDGSHAIGANDLSIVAAYKQCYERGSLSADELVNSN